MIWALPWVAGQLFDAMVGRAVNGLGSGPRVTHRPLQRSWEPPRGGAPARGEEKALRDEDLEGDAIKLVRYGIISLRPHFTRALPGGSGEVLVTISMTSEGFATWIIACYLQEKGHPPIPQEDKKYLRVGYEVLTRWPRESLCCDERQLHALEGIQDAIRHLPPPQPPEETAAPPVVEEVPSPVADPSPAEEEGDPVLEALRGLGGWVTRRQLVDSTGLPEKPANESLKALEAAGLVMLRREKGKPNLYHALTGGD